MITFTFLKTCVVSFWRLQLDRRCCTTWIDWGRLSFFGWHRGRIAPIPEVTCIELFSVEVWRMGPFSVEVSGPWRAVWLDRPFSCWQDVWSSFFVDLGPWRVVWLDRPFSCWQVVWFSFFVFRICFSNESSYLPRFFGWVEVCFGKMAKDQDGLTVEMSHDVP